MIHRIADRELSVDVSTVGARIHQLRDRLEQPWLVETGRREPNFVARAADFVGGTRGGWDDCLPSIDAEPDPNASRQIADHGDFWYREWNVESADPASIVLTSHGIEHPLALRKVIGVSNGRLEIETTAVNTGDSPYSLLVSAHPLFSWPSNATLSLPGAAGTRHGFGTTTFAGDAGRHSMDLGSEPWAGKTFVRWNGVARLAFTGVRGEIELRQSTETAPWLGVCVNRGSWPEIDPGPDWIALEPTTSPTDSLEAAVGDGTARVIPAGGRFSWTTALTIQENTNG